jgi:hypothetical protein
VTTVVVIAVKTAPRATFAKSIVWDLIVGSQNPNTNTKTTSKDNKIHKKISKYEDISVTRQLTEIDKKK